ncbi:hypothetical protein [Cognatishimia activa]|uniref:Uncharacterized protein n=1 Tax=Cognatishimia activa TaxID=1715691 RepID=A0A975I649_9RHOB|nr:hypothetical protein [Cognatishimia activa]QTN34524.1 hypothetical protein HZ995_08325 [Cognatishimia activa]
METEMPSKVTTLSRGMILCAVMVLGGCLSLPGQSASFQDRDVSISTRSIDLLNRARQRERVKLVKGAVIVRAPEGYCVDKSSRSASDFVLLGDCNVLRKAQTRLEPYERGLLTVSVGAVSPNPPSTSDLLDGLEAFGEPKRRGKLVSVLIEEGGDRLVPGADSHYWRAMTVVNGRVVSLAAFGPPYSEMALTRGPSLLSELAANIHAESPEIDPNSLVVAQAPVLSESSVKQSGSVFDFFTGLRQKN